MDELANKIAEIFKDYHYHKGFSFTREHVLKWVSQFDENDRQFILEEFLHLLGHKIYVSEERASKLLIKGITSLSRKYKFKDEVSFLGNVEFLHIQKKGKSQGELLVLLEKELVNTYGIALADCGTVSKKYPIYLDDILATGGTVFKDIREWLRLDNQDGVNNFDKIVNQEKILTVLVFCKHSWPKIDWQLKFAFNNDVIRNKINYLGYYIVQNHPVEPGESLNLTYPIDNQAKNVTDYLDSLHKACYKREFAFRKMNKPVTESFFSSVANRIRFENILLQTGIDLINKSNIEQDNIRPMGVTSPTTKTLGTGTMFFTWRNISNTTPLVFWWGAHWYPLFPLSNRGKYGFEMFNLT